MLDIGKLNRPPAAENWSRMQYPDVIRCARKQFDFVRGGGLPWNYKVTRDCARFYIEDRIDRQTALGIGRSKGSALGRDYNCQAISAFFDYVEMTPIDGVKAFDQMIEYFPLGPGAYVPIKPLAVIREDGVFNPIFLNPWARIAFDEYQARLYMTILEKSVFSLTDFSNSEGKIIFLPKHSLGGDSGIRKAVVWRRGEFPLLSDHELNEQVRIFIEGREIASRWIAELNGGG